MSRAGGTVTTLVEGYHGQENIAVPTEVGSALKEEQVYLLVKLNGCKISLGYMGAFSV